MHVLNLKVFCDLVESASFSLSAERNGITQSAVSQQIKGLEEKFGVTFFERGKKNFSITPEGLVFYQAAQRMLEIHGRIEAELRAVRNEVGGKLHLATVYSLGLHELPPLVKSYKARFPQVGLALQYRRAHEVYQAVADGRADLGLVAYPKPRRGLVVETFARDKMVLICAPSHVLASKPQVRLADLEGKSFIAFEPDLPTRKAVDQLFHDHGVTVQQTMEFDNIETVKRAVEIESGIAIVPRNSVREELAGGQLKAVELRDAEVWRPMGMVLKRGRMITPALREFMKLLRQFGRDQRQ
ncbi:MAG: LysR family transcriptional regulator [Verrucomicrobiales bacterium]